MLTFLRGSLPARRSPSLQREMKSDMTAEAFVERHGPALLQWLQTNTVECACTTPFGPDESLQRGTIDLTTSIACRRCYMPLSACRMCACREATRTPTLARYRTPTAAPSLSRFCADSRS